MLKNRLILISILIFIIISVGAVSASSIADDDLNQIIMDDDSLENVDSTDSISVEESLDVNANAADGESLNAASDDALQSGDEEPLSNAIKPSGTSFNDIQNAVNNAKANDVIELNGTYTSSGKAITIKKAVTFNGVNGATLDGKKLSGIFYIPTNVSVTFNNIKFMNAIKSAIYSDPYEISQDPYPYHTKVIVKNCNFMNNYNDMKYSFGGGAICALCNAIITDSNFTGNYVRNPKSSGASYAEGGAIYADILSVTNCNFYQNHAWEKGGAISSENLNITNCLFKGNYANCGGAVYGAGLDIKDSSFISNYLKKTSQYDIPLDGGAVYGKTMDVLNCIFTSNSATYNGARGGAIYGHDILVKNSVFEKNVANYAGAIYSDDYADDDGYTPCTLKIRNCSFTSNNEGAVRASKAIIYYASSTKTFKNKTLNNNLKAFSLLKVSANKLSTVYLSGKTMKIKIITSPSSKPAKKLLIMVTAKSSKKTYKIPLKTNSKGIATLKTSKLIAGYYKISIHQTILVPGPEPVSKMYLNIPGVLKTSTIKINKAKTVVKAPKVKSKYKKSKYLKVTVKHKLTKKAVKGLNLKLKVYTGKKFRTYTVKTNNKGLAKFNTKKLKKGKHKVIISTKNKNYIVSKKTYITIK